MRKRTLSLFAAGTLSIACAVGSALAQQAAGVVEMLERARLEPAGPPGALPPVRWDLNYDGVDIGLVYPRDSTELELSIPALGLQQVFSGATRADAKAQMIARLRGDPALVAAIDARAKPADMSAGYVPPEARATSIDYERLQALAVVDATRWGPWGAASLGPYPPVYAPGVTSGFGPGYAPGYVPGFVPGYGPGFGAGFAYGYGAWPYYGVPRPGHRFPYGYRPDVGPRLFGAIPVVPQPFVRPFFGVP